MTNKSLLLALGASLSFGLSGLANADDTTLKSDQMPNGYSQTDTGAKLAGGSCANGKCGNGKCGGDNSKAQDATGDANEAGSMSTAPTDDDANANPMDVKPVDAQPQS